MNFVRRLQFHRIVFVVLALVAVRPIHFAAAQGEEASTIGIDPHSKNDNDINIEIQTFVQHHYQQAAITAANQDVSSSLWVITESEMGDEMLFVLDNLDRRTDVTSNIDNKRGGMCGCRSRHSSIPTENRSEEEEVVVEEEACATADTTQQLAVVGIIGYVRPGILGRFCLWEDGRIDSFLSRRVLHVSKVAPAPSLAQLVDLIDDQGPAQTCLPGAHRGLLFETMELLCFALGHKPAVVRQRQQKTNGGGTHLSLLNGVPANLFVPHTRIIWTWLLSEQQEGNNNNKVWRGLSKVTWGNEDEANPPFEHSLIFAHDPVLGQRLVDLHVQDASVPAQADDLATANYIAQVGHALGYPRSEVQIYLDTSGVIPLDMPPQEVDDALERAFGSNTADDIDDSTTCHSNNIGEGGECRHNQPHQELPGFREFLDSSEAKELSPKLMRQVVEPLDALFFVH